MLDVLFLGNSLLLNRNLTGLPRTAGWNAELEGFSRCLPVSDFPTLALGMDSTTLAVLVGAEDPNPGPHALQQALYLWKDILSPDYFLSEDALKGENIAQLGEYLFSMYRILGLIPNIT